MEHEAITAAISARACMICGARENGQRWRLQAHHIDHRRAPATKDLLIIVCPRCHMRLHHWAPTDWRWLISPPPVLAPRILLWWARTCGLNLTLGEVVERQDELLGIFRGRLAAVFAPIMIGRASGRAENGRPSPKAT